MDIKIPEKNKKPGVYYTVTDDGVELPVVDITNPAFDPDLRTETMPGFLAESVHHMERWAALPGFARSLMSGRSIFTNQASHKGGGFVTGMTTYLMKLGAANLGQGYARQWDYRMASSLPMLSVQMRLRAMARLLADGLAGALSDKEAEARELHLLNIAGGSTADSWNTLLLIRKEHPEWLAGRQIRIRVLDLDEVGPAFGQRALRTLLEEGAPLHGLKVSFEHVRYNWSQPETLPKAIGDFGGGGAIIAGSSEGGLFEYGTDEQITANLKALREALPEDFFIVGSLFKNVRLTRAMKRIAAMTYVLRDEEPFGEVVCRAGWGVERVWNDNPVYWAVSIRKDHG